MKKIVRKTLFTILIVVLFSSWAVPVRAGFGVSPPTIRNRQLTPGSTYEKEIRLLRSSANEDLQVDIKIDAPEIAAWITLEKGLKFMIPKGDLQVPMKVYFNIPKNAELGNYRGHINVKVTPAGGNKSGGVSIVLGARIDIDLALTNVSFSDFIIKNVSIPSFERLRAPWNFKIWKPLFEKLFYRSVVLMNIENTGNIKTAPSKVVIEVYDISKKKLLETAVDKTIDEINSFSTESVKAYFPTKLLPGQYWSKIKVYKGSQIVNFYEIAFTVEDSGGLGAGARKLGVYPWLVMLGIIIIAILILLGLIKIKIWRYFIALIGIIIKPSFKGISSFFGGANKRFWKWVASQADKHKN